MMRLHDPRSSLAAGGRWLLPAVAAAAIAGFLVGGIGGRAAMFLLRVTSGPGVIGLESDDGFTIGRFSGETLFLVGAATVGSAVILGPLYAITRGWVTPRFRSLTFAGLLGLLGGAAIVNTDGIDFTELAPRPLAIVLFIALPAAFGGALEPIHERIVPQVDRLPRWVQMLAPAVFLPLLGAPPLLLGVIVVLGIVVSGRGDELARLWGHRVVSWAGRVAFAVIASIATVDLSRDISALL